MLYQFCKSRHSNDSGWSTQIVARTRYSSPGVHSIRIQPLGVIVCPLRSVYCDPLTIHPPSILGHSDHLFCYSISTLDPMGQQSTLSCLVKRCVDELGQGSPSKRILTIWLWWNGRIRIGTSGEIWTRIWDWLVMNVAGRPQTYYFVRWRTTKIWRSYRYSTTRLGRVHISRWAGRLRLLHTSNSLSLRWLFMHLYLCIGRTYVTLRASSSTFWFW